MTDTCLGGSGTLTLGIASECAENEGRPYWAIQCATELLRGGIDEGAEGIDLSQLSN